MSEDSRTPASPAKTAQMLVPLERTAIWSKDDAPALLRAVCFYAPQGIAGFWTPAPADLDGVERGLEKFLETQERKSREPWPHYFRQVAGLVQGGERTLFLSYFVTDADPRTSAAGAANDPAKRLERLSQEPFWVNDGGDTYFRVIYDLKTREFSWYEHNGDP